MTKTEQMQSRLRFISRVCLILSEREDHGRFEDGLCDAFRELLHEEAGVDGIYQVFAAAMGAAN